MTRTPNQKPKKRKQPDLEPRAEAGAPEKSGQQQPDQELAEYGYYTMDVEPFVPTDIYPSTQVRGKKKRIRKKKRALWAVLLVCGILLLAVGGVFAYAALLDPSAQFMDANGPQNTVGVISMDGADATPAPGQPTPIATPEPGLLDAINAQEDKTLSQQRIVNVMLIGVDYAEERETWNGKHEYHSDVMIIAAINFDENRVDLISLPRDTYAKIPGVDGIYKLNASVNCGGGFQAPGGTGFLKTCEAANWMIGNAYPINYYYAVTMPAVKQLINAIGGVDYNLDVAFNMMGRHYSAGPTHLNGQGVLDYLRVRKNVAGSGDLNRINRQKEMLVAIFESLQKQNLILKVPEILNSFDGQLFTNCTLGQTAALTKFAYSLDKNNIGMYSIDGALTNIFNWNFCLTDQNNRVDVIEKVYGKTVPKELEYTADYAAYRWADMIATQYIDTTGPMVDYISEALAADDLLPTMTPTLEPTETPWFVVTPVPSSDTPVPTSAPTEAPTPEPTPEPVATAEGAAYTGGNSLGVVRLSARRAVLGESYRRYSQQARQMFDDFLTALDNLEETQAYARKEAAKYAAGKSNNLKQAKQDVADYASHLKTNALSLAQEFGYPTSKFKWSCRYDLDTSFNEVTVDFR